MKRVVIMTLIKLCVCQWMRAMSPLHNALRQDTVRKRVKNPEAAPDSFV